MRRWLGSAAEVAFAVVLVGVLLVAGVVVNSGGRGEGVFNGVLLAEALVLVLVVCTWRAVREFFACRRAGASVAASAVTAAQRARSSMRKQPQ